MPNLTATIRGVVGQVLAVLNTRNKDVISRRFGLKTGKKDNSIDPKLIEMVREAEVNGE